MELREQKQEIGLYLTKKDLVEALKKNQEMIKMPFEVTFEGLQLAETWIFDKDTNTQTSEKKTVKRYNFKFSTSTLLKLGIASVEDKILSIDIDYLIGDELQELSATNAKINNFIKKLNKSTKLNEQRKWVDEEGNEIKGQKISMSLDLGSFKKDHQEIEYLIIKLLEE